MKKFLVVFLMLTLIFTLVACTTPGTGKESSTPEGSKAPESSNQTPEFDPSAKSDGVMTYDQWMAAEVGADVVVEAYVQAHQSWWDNKISVYAQDPDGGYFFYNLVCSEEDAAKLVPGTKIKVTGQKTVWGGLTEIMDGTFEIVTDGTWVAEATDVTALLGTDDLIKNQNMLVAFKDMTVTKIEYKNGEPGDDIYLTLSKGDASYDFCVEIYLTGEDTEVYQTVCGLKENAIIDVEGFLYWYEDAMNPHVTAVTAK